MSYSIEKITTLIGAHRYGRNEADIDWLLTDSRSLSFPENTLFFALRTRSGDGHRYISDLYSRGVRNFVVGSLPERYETESPGANFLLVSSPLKALQRLAERHRDEYNIPIVGITGSNGKTVVKEWLYQLLAPSMNVARSPRSYNSQIGVPLSVWLMNERSQLALFEAGISQPGEMEALRAIIQPTIGIITNIGAAHQENFATIEEKCLEKLSLFKDSKVLIYDADEPTIGRMLPQADFRGQAIGWSRKDEKAPLYISRIEQKEGQTHIIYIYRDRHGADAEASGQEHSLTLPFVNEASLQNCFNCLALCLYLGVSCEDIAQRMAHLEQMAMRLEVKQGIHGLSLINDSYNSDINSLDIALDFMNRRPELKGRRHTLILSDILQSGMTSEELYTKVADMIRSRGIDLLIGVGAEISQAHSLFGNMPKHFFPDKNALLRSGLLDTLHDEIVLLKGARSAGFEVLAEMLSLKVHETTLEVNLSAVVENVNYYRSFMQPSTKLTCMVKASAYGSGSVEIARTLQDKGVDYLAVAVADEGVELRKAGITRDILIMNPEMSSFSTLFAYNLQPEVYSFGLLEALIAAAEREGITDFPIHIKLDTGMCRLGFDPERDLAHLIDRLHWQNSLIPRSVFSHFVGSDSPDFDNFSAEQFRRFDLASQQLQAAFPHKILRHICNSAGIERFPERHLDMVRLGLGLYGVNPIDNRTLSNVASLRTTILQIHEVPAGRSVGYSRRSITQRPSRIAAIPIGYADGLDRRLGNGKGYCLVGDRKAPYIGNICMDVCMIDVTDIPCSEGDPVEIFGDRLPVTVLSDLLGTIPYEILTSVSERVKRVYFV